MGVKRPLPVGVKRPLRLVESTRKVLDAPPALIASDTGVDYICGGCEEVVLMHAEEGQVRGFVIRCRACGAFNATD